MSLREMRVTEVMTTDVVTFTPDENVQTAMQQLVDSGVDAGPVVDESGAVVGMLSTGDLIVEEARVHFPTVVNFLGVNVTWPFDHKELDDSVSKALGATVGEVMTAEPITVDIVASVEDAATVDARPRDLAGAGGRRRRSPGRAHRPGRHRPGHRAGPAPGSVGDPGRGIAGAMRAARAEVDLEAIAHNVRVLRELVAPAELCAVVKADGYGHGAIAVGQAALAAGAIWLGVALVEEGAVLRKAGIEAPILLLSEPRPADIDGGGALRPAAERLQPRRASRRSPRRPGPRASSPTCTSR